ncbi:hypothetical protein HPB52_023035 [Rhipicephalus sanguineus]|uniref:BTB domain-containing protein n=1 Tax=Rhipicephalus sanguineus TaxID=34632 RepID=A0A9D4PI38_RHISA|nr:hypothetical protein HPB52_023035 [Rhipicephalus sanguineus]
MKLKGDTHMERQCSGTDTTSVLVAAVLSSTPQLKADASVSELSGVVTSFVVQTQLFDVDGPVGVASRHRSSSDEGDVRSPETDSHIQFLEAGVRTLGDCSRERDVIICLEGDRIVEARSDRLRKVSRFFRQALTEDASVDGKFMIAISGISEDVLDTLLTYAETGVLNLYEHQVADVYFAAHKLQMPFVVHKCLQVRPLAKLEPLATGPSKTLPKPPQAPSATATTGQAAAEVKDGVTVEAKADQSQPIPGAEAAQAESQPKPELKSPPLQQPTQEAAATTGIGEVGPEATDGARAEVKPDQVQASATKSETEIPRILRIAPKPSRPQGEGSVADEISADARDDTYRAPSDKDKPSTSKDVQQVKAAQAPAEEKPSEVVGGGHSKVGTPKGIDQKVVSGSKSVQTTAADGGPQAIPGPSKVTSGSRATTPKSATGPKGTPVQGARTPLQKPVVQEVIGPATSQAQVLSAAPPSGARPKEQSAVEQQPRPVTPPSGTARTFLDVVLEHFKQLTPDTIRALVPTEVIELLKKDDLEICCYLCASLQHCRHLFPQYAVQPRKYSGRHMCHLWQLPYPRDTEDEVRVQLDILRETYLQQRHCHCSADTHDGLSLEGRLYGIARTLLLRRRYIDLHCYQPDPEEASRGPHVVQRSFGKRRYSVQKRLEWTEGVWRQVGFSARLRAPQGEPVIAILGGCEPDKPDRVSAGLCMARLYPKKSPFFKRFGILPRPLYHVKAVCFNKTVYVVGESSASFTTTSC